MLSDAKMTREPGALEMLNAALGWLENIEFQAGREIYLDAMPNNCLGVPAMRERMNAYLEEQAGSIGAVSSTPALCPRGHKIESRIHFTLCVIKGKWRGSATDG